MDIKELSSKSKEAYNRGGLPRVLKGIYNITFRNFYNFTYCKFLIILRPPGVFTFEGRNYRYFYHHKNTTWKNERAIEVPIIMEEIQSYRGGKILEVGNVLSNYIQLQHIIIDKYEKANGIINQDIVDFQSDEKYNLIVSISTIEHVGWDEFPKDKEKISRALENLAKCLSSDGKIVITLPIGYNAFLDELLRKGKIHLTEQYFLKRVSKDNKWIQASQSDVQDMKYGTPFPYANGIIIGIIKYKTESSDLNK